MRGKDLNQRPPGYEPDELPAALPRDIFLSLIRIAQEDPLVKRKFIFLFRRRRTFGGVATESCPQRVNDSMQRVNDGA